MTNLLQDVITYVRRIIKSPSNTTITDALIVDYINRFWMIDVDATMQLFDLKTKYQFQTAPGVDQYNMPLYDTQSQLSSQIQVPINLSPQPFPNGTAIYSVNLLSSFFPSNPGATLVPGTIQLWFDYDLGNQTLYQDNGAGNLLFVTGVFGFSSGTVNYTTGVLTLNFGAIGLPGTGVPVAASFTYNSFNIDDSVAMFPVYQGFMGPAYINGIEMPFYTQRQLFYGMWPNYNQTLIQSGTGNGTTGPYTLNLPFLPNSPAQINYPPSAGIIRGHIDITGIISTGNNQDPPIVDSASNLISTIPTTSVSSQVFFTSIGSDGSSIVIQDSGEFLLGNVNYGLLMQPGNAPYGNLPLTNGPLPSYSTTQNTINYQTGIATNVYFPQAIPAGMPINGQCVYYQMGIPRAVLFYNNTLTLRAPPNIQYLVELDAYLTPAAFFNSSAAIPFGYMAEYIARGAARKILSDVGDWDQFNAYERLFKEQESLVHIRSQRQWTATRTHTIYSGGQFSQGSFNQSSFGV
jgi:hypothetical protein